VVRKHNGRQNRRREDLTTGKAAIGALVLLIWGPVSPYAVNGGKSGHQAPALASYDWSATAPRNLARNPPPTKFVDGLLSSFAISESGDPSLGEGDQTYVCSFKFADLRHNGTLSLVAGIGIAGRGSCTGVSIMDKTTAGFELYSSGGNESAGMNVPDSIKDLRNDGHLEFLLSSDLGRIPMKCVADWTVIYAWTGANYTNVSDQFKDFYRQRLRTIEKAIPTLRAVAGPAEDNLKDKECLEAEAAAIKRFLGISPDAGLEQAVRLATSTSPKERDFATELLGEIGTPKARDYLKKLENDSFSGVVTDAKYALERSQNGPMKIFADAFIPSTPVRF
jgi:hypothetical protein